MVDPVSAGKVVKSALEKIDGPPAPDAPAGQLPEVTGLDAETMEFLMKASGGELRSMLGTELRFIRWKRAANIAAKAAAHLRNVGREARETELKVLVPALEAASLEVDEEMANRWAALLANAADPATNKVPPSFPEILKQLTSGEARLLDALYVGGDNGNLFSVTERLEPGDQTRIAVANLVRHQLILHPFKPGPVASPDTSRAYVTDLGRAFVEACRRSDE